MARVSRQRISDCCGRRAGDGVIRLRSDIWIQAYIRRIFANGAAAYVVRRGHAEAGAIFIAVRSIQGLRLFAPALALEAAEGDRFWTERSVETNDPEFRLAEIIESEVRFDPDIWVIEVEDRDGRHCLGEAVVED